MSQDHKPADEASDGDEAAPTPPPPPRRGPGHRGQDVRDTMAEMAAKAHEISLEAGSKMAATMREVIGAAAGLTAFAIESARDLVQYMVRRGQMTSDEADKLMREVEEAHASRVQRTPPAPPTPPTPPAPPAPPARPEPVRAPSTAPAVGVSGVSSNDVPAAKAAPKAAPAEKVETAKPEPARAAKKTAPPPPVKKPAPAPAKHAAKAAAKPSAKAAAKKVPAKRK